MAVGASWWQKRVSPRLTMNQESKSSVLAVSGQPLIVSPATQRAMLPSAESASATAFAGGSGAKGDHAAKRGKASRRQGIHLVRRRNVVGSQRLPRVVVAVCLEGGEDRAWGKW